jgi:hypothetical protein
MLKNKIFPLRPSSCFIFTNSFPVGYVFGGSKYRYNSAVWDDQAYSHHWNPMYMHKSFIFSGDWQSHLGLDEL